MPKTIDVESAFLAISESGMASSEIHDLAAHLLLLSFELEEQEKAAPQLELALG